MFSFFKKKKEEGKVELPALTYEGIVVDMHSHVLPGIDDGAQNVEESVELVKRMMGLGIKKIIATPHIMIDFYRNTPETIHAALEILKAELLNQGIDIPVLAAAEHFFDETFEERVNDGKLMLIPGGYVLFEYSFVSAPPNAFVVIQQIIKMGYKPVLAHPERYLYMTTDDMIKLRSWGCNLQLNTIALAGYYGRDVKRRAEQMVDLQIVDFISSDMHHLRHADALKAALDAPYLHKLLIDYPLKNILLK